MTQVPATQYRISTSVALVHDTKSKALRRQDSRRSIERRSHDLVIDATKDGVNGAHPDWWYDLRRGQLRIYGGLLRFLDKAVQTVPKPVLLLIPGWIREYIENL